MEQHIFKGIPIYDQEAFAILENLFIENRGQILASLPWLVSELIEHIGLREALEFIYKNGGKKIYIRNDCADLSRKFGLQLDESLYNKIVNLSDSSGYVEIPSPWGVSERIRKALIVSDFQRGSSREELRRTYGLSSRALTNIFRSNMIRDEPVSRC